MLRSFVMLVLSGALPQVDFYPVITESGKSFFFFLNDNKENFWTHLHPIPRLYLSDFNNLPPNQNEDNRVIQLVP